MVRQKCSGIRRSYLVDANNAQVKVRTAFNKYGLSEQLLKQ